MGQRTLTHVAYLRPAFLHFFAVKHDNFGKLFVSLHPTNSILRMNSNQVDFSTFCIGSVATALNMNQAEVYRRLKSSGILMDYIVGCYDVLHTFGRLYLVEDITSLMRKKGVL